VVVFTKIVEGAQAVGHELGSFGALFPGIRHWETISPAMWDLLGAIRRCTHPRTPRKLAALSPSLQAGVPVDVSVVWDIYVRDTDGSIRKLTPFNGRYYLSCIRPDGRFAVCQVPAAQ
jgi:hypothetical protein